VRINRCHLSIPPEERAGGLRVVYTGVVKGEISTIAVSYAHVGRSRDYCPHPGALELAGWPGFSAGQYCLRRWCTPAGGCRNTPLCLRVDSASPSPRPTLQ